MTAKKYIKFHDEGLPLPDNSSIVLYGVIENTWEPDGDDKDDDEVLMHQVLTTTGAWAIVFDGEFEYISETEYFMQTLKHHGTKK